ncbi:hypothetical protein [Nocardioides sp. T2.26MG-1]|uniref:hypothetical protein n=1 Tax=Nocardioides sp. T2.26MG-1 TaxID=3041166 RepID=UPI0024774773|nr:hypothetical protein [Nocardioides sp. T2.26MG-1]CAI9419054.1 hypothetical protein HIDPHFAB_03500 [Nocardioides sp. T2.26MG-1]
MTQLPPPYGPSPVPPRPAKPRPSAWWFGLGIALILSAVAAGVGLFVWTLSAFLQTDVEVVRDGEAHAVEVSTDGDLMLWSYDFESRPSCSVVDRATGDEIELRRPGGEFRRDSGTAGDWVGTWRFDPGSGDLEVSCTATDSSPLSTVEIGPAPRIGSFVVGILATIVVPLLLFLAGVAVLLVTGILWSVRPARTPAAP